MTQPTSCSSLIDPFLNACPYQMIQGVGSAIRELAEKIVGCVSAIFTAIADFITSCLGEAATPPTSTSLNPTQAFSRERQEALIAQGSEELSRLLRNIPDSDLARRSPEQAASFCARALIYAYHTFGPTPSVATFNAIMPGFEERIDRIINNNSFLLSPTFLTDNNEPTASGYDTYTQWLKQIAQELAQNETFRVCVRRLT